MSRSSCRRGIVTRRRRYKNGSISDVRFFDVRFFDVRIFDVRIFDVYHDGFDVVSGNVYGITLSRINRISRISLLVLI
jgi:hypothetical protein